MGVGDSNYALAQSMVQIAVPLKIYQLELRGGPSDEDFRKAGEWADICAERGDNLVFKSKKPAETAELFNGMVRAIAVLAFQPGGISIFGTHFETGREDRRVVMSSEAGELRGYIFLHGYNGVEQETIRQALYQYLPACIPAGYNYWLFYCFNNGALDKTPTYVARRLRWMWYQAIEAASAAELAEKLDFYYESLDAEAQADKQAKAKEAELC